MKESWMADDRELWERICRGDISAFEGFYRENAPRLQADSLPKLAIISHPAFLHLECREIARKSSRPNEYSAAFSPVTKPWGECRGSRILHATSGKYRTVRCAVSAFHGPLRLVNVSTSRLCLAGLRIGWFDPIAEAS